jgi:hypothetical protein
MIVCRSLSALTYNLLGLTALSDRLNCLTTVFQISSSKRGNASSRRTTSDQLLENDQFGLVTHLAVWNLNTHRRKGFPLHLVQDNSLPDFGSAKTALLKLSIPKSFIILSTDAIWLAEKAG